MGKMTNPIASSKANAVPNSRMRVGRRCIYVIFSFCQDNISWGRCQYWPDRLGFLFLGLSFVKIGQPVYILGEQQE